MQQIKLNIEHEIGKEVFIVKQVNSIDECPYCKGKGILILKLNDLELNCPNCYGKGYVENHVKKVYAVCTEPCVVEGVKVVVTKDDVRCSYKIKRGSSSCNRDVSNVFSTKEEAEEFCFKMNKPRKIVLLKDIVIQDTFKNSKPDPNKIKTKIEYYNQHGRFDKKIVVNEQNVLVDGYITYLIAKMYDRQMVECYLDEQIK